MMTNKIYIDITVDYDEDDEREDLQAQHTPLDPVEDFFLQ